MKSGKAGGPEDIPVAVLVGKLYIISSENQSQFLQDGKNNN